MKRLLFVLLLAALGAAPASAYQYLSENEGPPSHWLRLPIDLTVDGGPTDISGEIADATATWNAVPTAKDPWGALTRATVDFTGANFGTAWGDLTGDGKHEVIFDESGSALRALGLAPASVNGFGESHAVANAGNSVIDDMYLLINGVPSRQASFDRRSTEVHELGHTLGLAHSTVGFSEGHDGALDPVLESQEPTMHPYSIAGTDRRTLEADDIASLSDLYPEPSFAATTGTITGTVTRCGSGEPVLGANVRAVNLASPAVQLTRVTGFDGEEDGSYTIHGVPPGEYDIVVEPLAGDDDFVSRLAMYTRIDTDFSQELFTPGKESDCGQDTDPTVGGSVPVGATGVKTADFEVDGPGLAFVIDVTGSMGPEIGAIQAGLDQMIDTIAALPVAFPVTTIVTFEDSAAVRVTSRDPARLKAVVDSLTTSSTADCPEGSNAALMTAGRILGKDGKVVLVTDADSHPHGPSRQAVDRLYASKGLRLMTLLSGSCPPEQNPGARRRAPARAGGVDGGAAPDEERPLDELGPENAVRTFSEESLLSGGVLDFRPEIKTGTGDAVTGYADTLENMALSAVVPTVASVSPGAAPAGTALDVELAGSGTSFGSGSAVAVAGGGVAVSGVDVLSPTRVRAHMTVAGDAAPGFRDVTVTTGGEVAKGIGALHVTPAPAAPGIVSIAPAAVAAGTSADVRVSGALTHFAAGSTAGFGAGVAVQSLTAESPTSAVAHVTVAADAKAGFRDVTVTSGGETAGGGSLLVTVAPPPLPRLTTVTPATGARGQTVGVTITGADTAFDPAASVLSVGGSGVQVLTTTVDGPRSISAQLHVAGDAPLGFRDLIVQTGAENAALLDGFEVAEAAPAGTPTPAPIATPGPPPPPPPPPCRDTAAPAATIARAAGRRISGRAADTGCGGALARVEVAVSRRAGRRCRFATANGRLGAKRGCARPVFLRAKGTATWSVRFKHKLPRGRYAIRARARDAAGNVQARPVTRRLRVR